MKTESKLITIVVLLALVAGFLSFKMLHLQNRIQSLDRKIEEAQNDSQTAILESAILFLAEY